MSGSSTVEVDFEYESGRDSSLIISESEGRAFGLFLELAAYVANIALPGRMLRDIRFGTPARLEAERVYGARVDSTTRRVDVFSALRATGASNIVHLEAEVAALAQPETGQQQTGEMPAWEMGAPCVTDPSVAVAIRRGAAFLRSVDSYECGLVAQIDLSGEDCAPYQVHPLAMDCWWLLASCLCRDRGLPGELAPVWAGSLQVLKPGARIDTIRVIRLPPTNADTGRMVLVAEEAGEVASLLYDLRVASLEHARAQQTEPLQRRVERLVEVTLGRPPIGNDLVDAGATSLDLITILNALQRDLGVELHAKAFLMEPSVEQLVRMCAAALADVPRRSTTLQGPARKQLGWTQQDIWTTTQSLDVGPAYNECVSIELLGPLEPAALERSLDELLVRHPALRSSIRDSDGGLELQAHAQQLEYEFIDLYAGRMEIDPSRSRRHAAEYAKEFARRPFDLADGRAFRASLVREDRDTWLLVLCAHHVFVDGWSLSQVLLPDLCATYSRHWKQEASPVGDEIVAAEQPSMPRIRADHAAADLAWWQAALERVPSAPILLGQKRPPTRTSVDAAYCRLLIAKDQLTSIDALARRLSTTRFSVLLSAFAASMRRFTAEEYLCIGVPASNRSTPEGARAVGCFANMLPIPVHPRAGLTFENLIRDVTLTMREALARQDVPFSAITRAVGAERRVGTLPLISAVLAMRPALHWDEAATGLRATEHDVEVGATKTDLALVIREQEQALECRFEYRSALFSPEWIQRLSSTLARVLEHVVVRPDQAMESIDLRTDGDRERLAAWNSTTLPFSDAGTVYDRFAECAARAPGAPAVITATGVTSYGQLDSYARRITDWLVRRGAGRQPIGVCMRRSERAIAAALAIWRAGGTFVPVDISYPDSRQRVILEDAEVAVVLTDATLAELFDSSQAEAETPAAKSILPISERRPAYIVFTSGSSGRPKGVIGHHAGLLNLIAAQNLTFNVGPRDVVLQFAAFGFDAALWEICMALTAGASLAIPDQRTNASPQVLAEFMRQTGVTVATMPPAMWALLDEDVGRLRCAISAGESCSEAIVRKWERTCDVYNAYGPTEASICATLVRCNDLDGAPPIGRPLANVRIHLTDEQMRPVPVGWSGEICIAGVGVALGYVGNPDGHASRFVAGVGLAESGRVYRTGDIGRWRADGMLEFIGRNDRQIKMRGHRIELGEVESTLRRHPAVALCVARHEERESGGAIAAFVQCVRPITEEELKAFLRQHLPPHALPSRVIVLEEMPVNEHGKSDVAALSEGEDTGRANSELVARLVELWSGILGRSDVDRDTMFFDAGGDSLSAVRLIDLAQERGLRVSVDDLYTHSTPSSLALRIEEERTHDEAVDLGAEAAIDLQVAVPERAMEHTAPSSVLVTGATGFLGAFIVRELLARSNAEVVCLVRGASDAIGRERIRHNMSRLGIWEEAYWGRIVVVVGDLRRAGLGLSTPDAVRTAESVQAIVHCGARVDLVASYQALRDENVFGTLEILRLAAMGSGRPLHFVSTLAVTMASDRAPHDEVISGDQLSDWKKLIGGYTRSKWVAEQAVQRAGARGLAVQVYRPGLIVADTRGGRGPDGDVFGRFVRACVEVGAVPREMALRYLGPVDRIAGVIVQGVLAHQLDLPALHLADPRALGAEALAGVIQRAGGRVELEPYERWRARVQAAGRGSPLRPLLPFFPTQEPPDTGWPKVRCEMDADERPVVDAQNWSSLDRFVERLVSAELRGRAPENT